jgi:hypothetical protein
MATCKNCGKPIEDEQAGFCTDSEDRCWKEWVAKRHHIHENGMVGYGSLPGPKDKS